MESGSKYQRPLDYQIRKLGDPCGIYYGFQTEYLVFRHLTIDQQMHHTADQTVRSYALLGFKNSPSPPAVDNGMALK